MIAMSAHEAANYAMLNMLRCGGLKPDHLLSKSFEVPRRSLQYFGPLGYNVCGLRSDEGLAEGFGPAQGSRFLLAPRKLE